MVIHRKLHGGVVTSQDHMYGLVELVTFQLRNRVDFVHYTHPYQVEVDLLHDFVIVMSLDDLKMLVKLFQVKGEGPPLLVHIDTPDTLRHTRHDELFPDLDVLTIPQADLSGEPDVTLDLHVFEKIITRLRGQDR